MFGIDLFDASLGLSVVIAMLAGLISFLSPCVLPIVPPYLAYMSGVSMGSLIGNDQENGARHKAFLASLFFVLGLSTVFIFLGIDNVIEGRFHCHRRFTFLDIDLDDTNARTIAVQVLL